MAEYIEREALAEKLRIGYCGNCSARYNELKCRCCDVDDVISEIEEAPTADVVEVVRCKDCKYQDDCARQMVHTTRDYVLEQNISTYNKIDFCSFGAKMDGKGEGE